MRLTGAKLLSLLDATCAHSFASRYVQAGGSLMKLAAILGHSAAETSVRYAHLQPGNFTDQERALVDVQLAPARVVSIASRTA